ncbi:MAG TPA: hypothetical protein VE442_13355 [Jatrophihabitans sp.]|nr:hypothetical protein [Jatrophihabitans sp.]
MTVRGLLGALVLCCVLSACSSGSVRAEPSSASCPLPPYGNGADYHPRIEPAHFGPDVTNPWYPLRPGTTYRYRGLDEGDPVVDVVVVIDKTRVLDGVRTRVVFDRLFQSGNVVERTHDYFAQDSCGNVWYFGEDTAELNDQGKVTSTEGTWHSGVDGAQPGVFMPARPHLSRHFRQEWYPGHAEDTFSVADLSTRVRVPAGTFPHALRTEETTRLEPGVIDNKWYAKGVGDVSEVTVKGPQERLVLVQISH